MRPPPAPWHKPSRHHETKRLPLLPPPARALGRGGHAEDRLQRALPDVLRHGGGRLLARAGLALRAGHAPARRRPVRARRRRSNSTPRRAATTSSTSGCAAAASATRRMLFEGAIFRGDAAADHRRAGLRVRRPGDPDLAAGAAQAARDAAPASRPASRWCEVRTGSLARARPDAGADPHRGVRRGAAHPGRDGMGRSRRRLRCMPWPTTGSGQPLATGRLLQADPAWPRSAAWRCCRCCAAAGVGRAGAGSAADGRARSAATARVLLHAQRSAEGFYARAWASSPSGEPRSTKPASRTSRWRRRCRWRADRMGAWPRARRAGPNRSRRRGAPAPHLVPPRAGPVPPGAAGRERPRRLDAWLCSRRRCSSHPRWACPTRKCCRTRSSRSSCRSPRCCAALLFFWQQRQRRDRLRWHAGALAAAAADGVCAGQHGLVAHLPGGGGGDPLVRLQPAAVAGPEHAVARTPARAGLGHPWRRGRRLALDGTAVLGRLASVPAGTESGVDLRQPQLLRRVRGVHAAVLGPAAGARRQPGQIALLAASAGLVDRRPS